MRLKSVLSLSVLVSMASASVVHAEPLSAQLPTVKVDGSEYYLKNPVTAYDHAMGDAKWKDKEFNGDYIKITTAEVAAVALGLALKKAHTVRMRNELSAANEARESARVAYAQANRERLALEMVADEMANPGKEIAKLDREVAVSARQLGALEAQTVAVQSALVKANMMDIVANIPPGQPSRVTTKELAEGSTRLKALSKAVDSPELLAQIEEVKAGMVAKSEALASLRAAKLAGSAPSSQAIIAAYRKAEVAANQLAAATENYYKVEAKWNPRLAGKMAKSVKVLGNVALILVATDLGMKIYDVIQLEQAPGLSPVTEFLSNQLSFYMILQ